MKIADFFHLIQDIWAILAAPGGEGNGNVLFFCHGVAQAHIVHHQHFLFGKAEVSHNGGQGIVAGLAQLLRQVPSVDLVRENAEVFGIVPADVFPGRVGYYEDPAPQGLLPPDDGINAGVGGRNVGFDVFLPAEIFRYQLFLRKAEALAAKFRKAQPIAAIRILCFGNGGPWPERGQSHLKIGQIYGELALHHSVVMIQNQTGIFQHRIGPPFSLSAIITEMGERRNRNFRTGSRA